jgi:hypothetical protein
VAGCSSASPHGYVEDTYPIAPGHYNHPEVIGRGRLGTNEWTLRADVSGNGQLCMGVTWRPAAGPQEYGCGFGSNQVDDEGRDTQPTATAQARDGSVLVYGPAPAGTVRAVLTTASIPGTACHASTMPAMAVPITRRLPAWYPRPSTGWFTAAVPTAAASCVIDIRFVDAHGHRVDQPNNF